MEIPKLNIKKIPKLNINKNWAILIGAIVMGGIAVLLTNYYISNRIVSYENHLKAGMKPIKVVVAQRNLQRGARITADDLAVRDIPKSYVHDDAVTPDRFKLAEGQRLVSSVGAGKALLWAHLEGGKNPTFSGKLIKGKRALTFPVNAINSISGMLQPGDRIDLVATLAQDGRDITFPLLQDIRVLATGTQLSPRDANGGARRRFTTITLQTTPDNANKIILARSAGKLTAVLRNPDDQKILPAGKMDVSNLFSTGTGRDVEFIIGGGG